MKNIESEESDDMQKAIEILAETMELNSSIPTEVWLDACLCFVIGSCMDEGKNHQFFCDKIEILKSQSKWFWD